MRNFNAMNKLCWLIILFSICRICEAQNVSTFNKHYDSGSLVDITCSHSICENAGGYLFVSNSGLPSAQIAKLIFTQINFTGDTLWSKSYGQQGLNAFGFPRGLNKIANSTNYAFGVSYANYPLGITSALIGKINSAADTLWTNKIRISDLRTYTACFYYSSLGEYISCGPSFDSLPNGQADLPDGFFIKADTSGNFISTKKYPNPGSDWLWGVAETPDHGFLLAGNSNSINISNGGYDFYVIRVDSVGNMIWQQCYGGANDEWGEGIVLLNDGNYLLFGERLKGRIYKIDVNGSVIWQRNYNTSISGTYESISGVTELPNGDIVTAGFSTNSPTGNDCGWAMRLNSNGYKLWERYFQWDTIGSGSIDELYEVIQTSDGGLLFGGVAHLPGLTADDWIWKLDENGCDSAGCATMATGIEVENYAENDANVIAYPNPFKGNNITLMLPIMPQDGKIEVAFFNNLGQEVLTTSTFATHPAHVNIYDNRLLELSSGMYFVQLKTKRETYGVKVLKQ